MARPAPMLEPGAGGASEIQAENGHTRIAHPVLEALALAPFNASQLKVLLYVVRNTWGWNRKETELGYSAVCADTGLAKSSISDAVNALLREGVLLVVQEPDFRSSGTYRLQKDPRQWGRFSCTPPSLDEFGAPNSSGGRTVREAVPNSSADRTECSASRTVRRPKSLGDNNSQPPKDSSKDSERHHPSIHQARVGAEPETEAGASASPGQTTGAGPPAIDEDLVSSVIIAANAAMTRNQAIDQIRLRPILTTHGSRHEVADWLLKGIPIETILEVVERRALEYQPDQTNRQISTMAYFTRAVIEADELRTARAMGGRSGKRNHGRGAAGQVRGEAPGARPAAAGGGGSGRRSGFQYE